METITSPTQYNFEAGREYLIKNIGAELTVAIYKPDGSTLEVEGSPLLDGESKFFLDESANGKVLLVTTSSSTVSFTPTKR